MTGRYDVIIIGSGAGGGIAAGVLAEAGKRVLLLERGQSLSFEQVGRDHLRNQRISLYGHNAGPDIDGNPRVFVNQQGRETVIRPHEGNYNNNAATVGGGTRVYGAQAWRFMEQDFRMASIYGVPEGSSLADWPISYDELEPFYERAEWEIGVSGSNDGNKFQAPRRKGYPMPALRPTKAHGVLKKGADLLGWSVFQTPLAINSQKRDNREACIECQFCVGFACPSDSKNGSHNTMIPRALKTGNCTLVTGAMAQRIETDAVGKATGVTYLHEANGGIERKRAEAPFIVVSAGAIESARLLLNSSSPLHPNGIGNENDQVGRNLQGHLYPGAQAVFEEAILENQGPGVSISLTQFNHGNDGIIGGGMLSDEFIKLPIIFWSRSLPPDVPRWGKANKDWMRHAYRRTVQIMGPVQDIPNPEGRVTIDPAVQDRFGLPVARLSGTTHAESVRTAEFMRGIAIKWLEAAGAETIWSSPQGLGLSGGQHQAGTCRMGDDPNTSVTDKWGRIHGHDNLFVIDGSLNVTNGGFNPVLTIMALAFRSADYLAKL